MWQRADSLHTLVGQSEHCRHDGRADDDDQHRRYAAREARHHQQDGEAGDAHDQRCHGGLIEALEEGHELVYKPICVGGKTEQLWELTHDDDDAEAVHVAHLHFLRKEVGHEAEFAESHHDLDRAHEERKHPGKGDRGGGVASGKQGYDGREDEGRDRRVGPEHQHPRGAEEEVGDKAGDCRVEACDGGQAR